MKSYTVFQVDSFTKQQFKGNPAGVIPEADGLTETQMQSIARELNNSETAFILSPTAADHDVWVRFFTPTTEVPLCGHATIAAHYVRAKLSGAESSTILQKTGAGILPLQVVQREGDYEIIMTQGELEFLDVLQEQFCREIASALELKNEDLKQQCPIQIVSAGHSKVMIGINSRDKLNSLTPNFDRLARLSKEIHCNGYYVFTFDTESDDVLTNGRMFAPAIGIQEDPVTGNANGPLGAYLVHHNLVSFGVNGVFQFRGMQGEAIGRTGIVKVLVDVVDGKPTTTRVGGQAVVVFQTEITI